MFYMENDSAMKSQELTSSFFSWKYSRIFSSSATLKGHVMYITITALVIKALPVIEAKGLGFDLPFNWRLMLISAFLYLFAYLLYYIFCPHFIKKFPSFNSLSEYGFFPELFLAQFKQLSLCKKPTPLAKAFSESASTIQITNHENMNIQLVDARNMVFSNHPSNEKHNAINMIYHYVYWGWGRTNLLLSGFVCLIYLASFALFGWVLFENIRAIFIYFFS